MKGFYHKHPKGLGSHLCLEPCHRSVFLLGGAWARLRELVVYKVTETLP